MSNAEQQTWRHELKDKVYTSCEKVAFSVRTQMILQCALKRKALTLLLFCF